MGVYYLGLVIEKLETKLEGSVTCNKLHDWNNKLYDFNFEFL